MIESIVLGTIQGVAEWLPISSEGLIALVKINLFQETNIESIIRLALFLHLGTFLAALLYLRKDVIKLLKTFFAYPMATDEDRRLLRFLILATFISGGVGLLLLKLLIGLESATVLSGRIITAGIGTLLLVTAALQLRKKKSEAKDIKDLVWSDGVVLGLVQGLSALPGLSRSGLTVSAFLLRRFNDMSALRLSFLMSLPIVLAGNVVLNLDYFRFSLETLLGLLASFVFGIFTIHLLLKFAEKTNLGFFVLIFGFLMVASAFI